MKRIVFARFDDRQAADAAVAALREGEEPPRDLRIHTHEHGEGGRLEEQVQHSGEFAETDMRHAFLVGIGTGAGVGAVVGGVLAATLFSASAAGVLAGGGLGILMGVLLGVIMSGHFGPGTTDRRLLQLAEELREGDVILTLEVPDERWKERVTGAVRQHGGRFAEKSAV